MPFLTNPLSVVQIHIILKRVNQYLYIHNIWGQLSSEKKQGEV
jgi:hypothetical protein